MTVESTSTEVAVPASGGVVGLEDIDASDLTIPRLAIAHKEGVLKDTQSNETFEELEVILLGLVKQRVLWDTTDNFDTSPLCKSYDFHLGHPDLIDNSKRRPESFPFDAAGFDRSDFPGDEIKLDCGSCALQEWGSHPGRDIPWCTEQWVFPLVLPSGEEGDGAPAILTLQRSQLKPTKAYVTSFQRIGKPLFVNFTKITLEKFSRGQVDYCVPKFTKLQATPEEMSDVFAENYLSIRKFLMTPRVRKDDDGAAGVGPGSDAPTPAADAPSSDPAESGDEIPF